MKTAAALALALVAPQTLAQSNPADQSLYTSFPNLVNIDGMPTSLARFKGNVSLVINVATYWGETKSSYEGISSLGTEFAGKPFAVLGFPANQYGDQEPNSNAEIKTFASGSGKHDCGCDLFKPRNKGCALPGPYCNWVGQAIPPLYLFAKTNVKAPWCTGTPTTDCTSTSKLCCATNQAVWQWLEKANSTSYPPAWNWAGKHLFDKCGKLRLSVSSALASVKSLEPQITALLAETPSC